MTVETFRLPDVGEGVAEGELLRWLVEPDETIEEDQPLAEVETDKAVVDLPSPYAGSVTELHVAEGEMVPVGTGIVSVEVDDGETADDEASEGDAAAAATDDTGARRAFAAPSTRRLARELGVDVARVEGSGPGGRVTDADVRAAADDEAGEPTATGRPEPRSLDPDATVVLSAAGELETEGRTRRESARAVETASEAVERQRERDRTARDRTLAAPATRGLADELGVDLDTVPTDRERDGVPFVTAAMVREYAARVGEATDTAESADAAEVAATEGTAETTASVGVGEATGDDETAAEGGPEPGDRIPYRGIRRSIGEQMERSKYTAPHATHTDEVDVTRLVETKAELEAYAEAEGVTLTYLPFVMRAVTRALREFPRVNASLDEAAEEIVCHDEYNLGIATATDAGLMVPVVEDVDGKGLLDLAAETATKVERARDRSIGREEMQGGTFTITNVGVIGGEYATPIVNYPEVAILALGRVAERPRVVDGEVVPRYTLPLSLSVDHRVVDGAVAARFTNRVMDLLRSPSRLLVD
ncbi:dihydrolipoamide acetyltransferase family protein [Haloplanus salinarum]|uniref:dihydrolipoamide acetyltransferase family protein n=1 Tax=Haloplanus salinarum TaxID=1912324 RepID=UPI00214B86B7|nr:dihydrolipoamide acetyltransferase family protein [Haloplanus salinarum]